MPRFRFRDGDDCCVGAIDIEIPGGPGHMRVAAVGDDRADALGRAALIAERIASDPVMRALMPPQAIVAIKAAKGLSAAAKRGSHVLRHFWGQLRGPGKKRLASVLHAEAVKREQGAGVDVSGYELGLRNPFRRKKKRRVPPMRRPPVQREQEPEPEESEAEETEAEATETGDAELHAMSLGAQLDDGGQ